MKKIIILNGSPRLVGNTSKLIESFKTGAEKNGNEVEVFNLFKMNIKPCLGCYCGGKDAKNPCVQKDDMGKIYPKFEEADIVVLASPMYYWSFTAILKCAFDRLFAVAEKYNEEMPKKDAILLMASAGDSKEGASPVVNYYEALMKRVGWRDLGQIYAGGVTKIGDIKGHKALEDAKKLGESIK